MENRNESSPNGSNPINDLEKKYTVNLKNIETKVAEVRETKKLTDDKLLELEELLRCASVECGW
jgi:hypothetical protein